MTIKTWEDAYQELWKQAVQYRGLQEAIGAPPGHMLYQALRRWPRTRGADVLAIAAVIDPVLRDAALESGGYAVEHRWRRCASELADVALRDPAREYHHNRTFWSTLASISAFLASVDASVPEDLWRALLAELATDRAPHDAVGIREALRIAADRYDELWQTQKTALAELRGSDVRETPLGMLGGPMAVPRTTNADALQLATYWTHALAETERRQRSSDTADPERTSSTGLAGEERRWREAMAEIDAHAKHGDPAARYPRDHELWRATGSLSATLAAIGERPAPFELWLDPSALDPSIDRPHASLERRNASYPGEGSFETMWDKQHADFVEAHGFDLRDPLPGGSGRAMKIPRTLNAEVVQLATYWNAAWKKLESRRGVFGNLPTEQGLDRQKKRWEAVMKDVDAIARPGKAEEIYPRNHEFWREAHTLAVTLDLFHELPTKFDIAIDVARTLPDRVADVVGQIAHAVGDIAHKAGEGVTSGLGKPLVIGGGVVLGGLLLWRLTRRKEAA